MLLTVMKYLIRIVLLSIILLLGLTNKSIGAVNLTFTGSVVPIAMYVGNNYTVSYTIRNNGSTSTSTSFYVSIFLSPTTSYNNTTATWVADILVSGGLAANTSTTRTVSITIPSNYVTGSKNVIGIVDATNAIIESNEATSDNHTSLPVTLYSAPDLVTNAFGLSSSNINSGSSVTATFDIKLFGSGSAKVGSFNCGFYLSSTQSLNISTATYLGASTINELGNTTTGSLTKSLVIPSSITPGTYYIHIWVDKDQVIFESVNNNNFQNIPVTISSPCTQVSIATHPQGQTVNAGSTATFSVIVNGSSPFLYFWYKNNVQVSGTSNSSYTTPTLSSADNGSSYKCIVKNCNNGFQATSNSAYITVISVPSCTTCPSYDLQLTPTTSYQSVSSSHGTNGCKVYKINVTTGNTYTFKTGCGNSATADYDTYLELYNSSCNAITNDDDGCENNRSQLSWTANFTGSVYLKIKGLTGSAGNYTLSYVYSSPCTPPTVSAGSNSPISIGGTLVLTSTTISGASYAWSGPNGFSSISQNPVRTNVTSTMAGSYCVTATVGGCTSNTSCTSLSVNSIPPVASFSVSNNNPLVGTQVIFSDLSINTPTSWEWTFYGGSPSFSTSKNPTVIYNSPNKFTVSLKVCNSAGCSNVLPKNAYIVAQPNGSKPAQPTLNYCTRDDQNQALVADPIQIGTGTYKYKHTDFALPSLSGQLVFTRCYNSSSYSIDGPLGFGWSHSFNYVLSNFADSLWQVKYPDGHIADFIPLYNGGGSSFSLFAGTTDSLYRSSGFYYLITKDKFLYQFNTSGRLLTITDANQNSATLHYDNNLLDSVKDSGGRYFVLTGNPNTGKISSISVPSGKICRFNIDINSNLLSSTNPSGDSIHFEYDTSHQLLSFTNNLGDIVLKNTYTNHQVTAQSDVYDKITSIRYSVPNVGDATVTHPDNSTESFKHNSSFLLTSRTDELGNTSTLGYDENAYPDSSTNEKGQLSIFQHDQFGNILSQTLPGNRIYSNKFNTSSKPLEMTAPNGHKVLLNYDGSGNLVSLQLPDQSKSIFQYNVNGTLKRYINTRGDSTDYFYNVFGDIIKVVSPAGERGYTYDQDGRVIELKNENANTTKLNYDNNGNVTLITDALNQSIGFTYDKESQLKVFTDKMGFSTHFLYDKKGRLVARTNALQGTDSFYYDVRDRLIKSRNAKGQVINKAYDSNGRLIDIVNSAGKIKFAYNELSALSKVIDTRNNEISFNYSQSNFLTTTINALNQKDSIELDGVGNVIKHINHKNRKTSYEYNKLNRLLKVTDANQIPTAFQYDSSNNLTKLIDGNGHLQSLEYGILNRLKLIKDANGDSYSLEYDAVGNVIAVKKPSGAINYEYDKLNRLVKATMTSGEVCHYNYDANDNVTSMSNGLGVSIFTYDSLNRMRTYTDPFQKVVQYSYDEVGNVTSIIYPGNKAITYTYDNANRLIKVKNWKNSEFVYSYDSGGNVTRLLYPNNIHCDYTYDAIDRVISKITYLPAPSNSILYGQQYSYFNDSVRETRYGSIPSGFLNSSFKYQYRADDALLNDSLNTFINDSNGNRIKEIHDKDTTNYSYTTDQLLVSIKKNGITTSYGYDAWGHRIYKGTETNKSRYVLNLNSPLSLVMQITDENGNLNTNYIYGLGLLEQIDSVDNELFYHFDQRHNTIALTDKNDSVQSTYTYLLFGTLVNHTGSTNQPFTFLGEFGVESESDSCYYIRARYYDAATGRFLSKDPLFGNEENPLTLNRYTYSMNNPVTMYDVTGLYGNSDNDKSWINKGQQILGLAGFIPILGAFPDVINSIIYSIRGDPTQASLNLVFAVPFIGDIVAVRKLTKGAEAVKAASQSEKLWNPTYKLSSVENALKHYNDHGHEFPDILNAKQYVESSKKFLHDSPEGTLTFIRPGDQAILKYNPGTNTFGVMTPSGTPRTMYKPKDGIDYWLSLTR